MNRHRLGLILAWLIAAGIIVIGSRFLLDPIGSSSGYGVPQHRSESTAYLYAKGTRDIVAGLITVILLLAGRHKVLAAVLAVASVIPLGDAFIVADNGGAWSIVLGVHVATASVMLMAVALLLVPERRTQSSINRG